MASPRVARAKQLAEELTAAGVKAYHDVRKVQANRPCVLVGPPRLSYETPVGALATWRLVVLGGAGADQHTAWTQLDKLLDDLADELPIETAEPISWAATQTDDPSPAYAVTYNETVE